MRNNIVITVIVLSFISTNLACCNTEKMTVTGVAEDEKNVAVVYKNHIWYRIDGLHHWDTKYLGRNVRVRGNLIISRYIPDTTGVTRQTNGEDRYFLFKAKWKLVK